jgi:hypothetical protein
LGKDGTAPHDRSDVAGHRTVQAEPLAPGGVREPTHPQRTAPLEMCRRAGSESGNPAHPKPFGMRRERNSASRTHSCALVRNGCGWSGRRRRSWPRGEDE